MMNFLAATVTLLSLVVGWSAAAVEIVSCRAVHLKCEYLTNPLGIDASAPRLTWQLADKRRGANQKAYQVFVSKDSSALLTNKNLVWNSGKVLSDSSLVTYKGGRLHSRTRYYWRVIVWDKDGVKASPSAVASFETAIFDLSGWRGKWISDGKDINDKSSPYFRKSFSIAKKVKRARVYVASLGYYELSINGRKVGDHMLDPGYTRFDKRLLYVTYDITPFISKENCFGILLGNGWFNEQSKAVWYFDKAPWRRRPQVLINAYLEFEDGTVEELVTDESWKTSESPIVFNNIYSGEYYDARREQQNWDTYSFNDTNWKKVKIAPPAASLLKAQALPPIRVTKEIEPVSFKKITDSHYLFDMGQNFAGISRLVIKGDSGTVVTLKHGEVIGKNGLLDNGEIGRHYRFEDKTERAQTDKYILRGGEEESYSQRFTYHGYRYVEVTLNKPAELGKKSLKGLVLHTDVKKAASFTCSNDLLNRIYEAGMWTYLSNLHSVPTDCPQREKNGWTADGHIGAETGLMNFDAILAYEKWIADFHDEQRESGEVPGIVPTSGWGYDWGNGPAWDSALLLIPYYLYQYYGDDQLIRKYYDNYKRYVDYLTFRSSNNLVNFGLGDWLPYKTKTPVELTSSAYYFKDTVLMALYANIIGKQADYLHYSKLAESIKLALNKKYLDEQNSVYDNGSQTALSAALYQQFVPAGFQSKVADALAKEVRKTNHLDVGLLGSKYLLNALSDNGYADLAYTVATQTTKPSWGYWLVNGETAFLESWDLNLSRNHIMLGEVVPWMHRTLAGINIDPVLPGYKHILIKPNFIDDLSYVKATKETLHGTIISEWKRKGSSIDFQLTIPPNTTASVFLPLKPGQKALLDGKRANNKPMKLLAGQYKIAVQ